MNTSIEPRRDVEVALAALGDKFISLPFALPNGGSVIFHGKELVAHSLQPLDPTLPDFVTASETVVEPASFKDYVRDFKSPTAICRASLSKNEIVAVLDYHGKARMGDRDSALPQRAAHVVKLLCPFDLDYDKWRQVFDKPMSQSAFGNLLEDMVHTISEPAVADLQEAVDELRIDRAVRFKSGVNRRNGTVQLTYEEIEGNGENGGGKVNLPEEIKIIVPIFQGGELIELVAKFRYRMDKGIVAFIVTVPGLDKIEREQFRRIGEAVRAETSTPVFYTV
ncbi:DUF2303 family protein [Devosia sp. 2618]|uniref:DUF2303 family protein n=1 Tax=Devosia sp. 2618 TaxID=3156454 RepID=UPI0033991D09